MVVFWWFLCCVVVGFVDSGGFLWVLVCGWRWIFLYKICLEAEKIDEKM